MDTYNPQVRELTHLDLADLFEFVHFLNEFRRIRRKIWYRGEDVPEDNGDHSYQLMLACVYINMRWKLGLDPYAILMYSATHDWPERYAKDECLIVRPECPNPDPAAKKEREHEARLRIADEWGERCPELVQWMMAYEDQQDRESKFVYAADKLIACLNIFLDDGRTNIGLKVTRENRDVYKNGRCAVDPIIGRFNKLLNELLDKHPEHFYQVIQDAAA